MSRCNAPCCSAVIGKARTGRAMHHNVHYPALFIQRFVRHYTSVPADPVAEALKLLDVQGIDISSRSLLHRVLPGDA